MRTLCTMAVAGAIIAGLCLAASADPVVPGMSVETYVTLPIQPQTLSFDPVGNLYVGAQVSGGSLTACKVYRVAPNRTFREYGNSALSDPDAVLFDAVGKISGTAGSVLVGGETGTNEGYVSAILPDESVVNLFQSSAFRNPGQMAFTSMGDLVFTDYSGFKLLVSDGATVATIAEPNRPYGLAVGDNNTLYVSIYDGAGMGGIRVFDVGGTVLNQSFVQGYDNLYMALAFGNGGIWGTSLYAMGDGNLLRFDIQGNSTVIGTGFNQAISGIAFGPDGGLYISDSYEGRILRITPEPAALSLLGLGALAVMRRRLK